jgi:extradiol dioxygenase family protein
MIKISAVTHWGVPVNDLDEAERFYTEIMGFRAIGRLPNGHMSCFEVCGQEIVLFLRKEPLVRTPEQDGLLHPLAFELAADEWEKAAHLIHERDIPLALPIQYRTGSYYAGRELYILDPSGNMIELRDATWTAAQPRLSFEELVGAASPAGA